MADSIPVQRLAGDRSQKYETGVSDETGCRGLASKFSPETGSEFRYAVF